jgi:protein gp37
MKSGDSQRLKREMTENPTDLKDWWRIAALRKFKKNRKCIGFEPLLGPLPQNVSLKGIDWVIIGALSRGNRKRVQPRREWIQDIVKRARRYKTPIFLKDSLKGISLTQQYP